jgi:hypothetical protein
VTVLNREIVEYAFSKAEIDWALERFIAAGIEVGVLASHHK